MGAIFRRKYKDKNGNQRTGEYWWIKYFQTGREYRESSGSPNKKDAVKLLRLREGKIVEGKFPGLHVERVTLESIMLDVLNDYERNDKKSIGGIRRYIKTMRAFFGECRAKEITTARVNKYMAARKKALAANASINLELSFLKRAFSLAVKAEKLDRAPYIPKLAVNNVRPFFFEHEDYLKIKEALPDHLKPVIMLAYHSGMRREEMLSLTWDKVDLVSGRIVLAVGSTKNKEARIIPIAGELLETLIKQRQDSEKLYPECPFVFHYKGKRMRDCRGAWEQALQACGFNPTYICKTCGAISAFPIGTDNRKRQRVVIKGRTVKRRTLEDTLACHSCGSDKLRRYGRTMHDFRRSSVRNTVRSGVPESIAMKLSGHKTRSVFDRYNIVNEADLEAATAKIMEYHRTLEVQIDKRKPYLRASTGSKVVSNADSCNNIDCPENNDGGKRIDILDRYGAADRGRTDTTVARREILSLLRLPVPPQRHGSCTTE